MDRLKVDSIYLFCVGEVKVRCLHGLTVSEVLGLGLQGLC